MGELPLRESFNRLFRLSDKKDAKINEMGSWESEGWKWNLNWRHNLRAREVLSLNSLLECFVGYKLEQSNEDYWRRNQANNDFFSTKKAYACMADLEGEEDDEKILWGQQGSKKNPDHRTEDSEIKNTYKDRAKEKTDHPI